MIEQVLFRVNEAKEIRDKALKQAKLIISLIIRQKFSKMVQNGCPVKKLKDVLITTQYGTSKKAHSIRQGFPILRMKNIVDGRIDVTDLKYIELDEASKYVLQPGDILINRTNSKELVGKSAIFDLKEPHVFASYLIRLRINLDIAEPSFINYLINSNMGRDYIAKTCRSMTNQANINATEIRAMPILLPPMEEQKQMIMFLNHLRSKVNELNILQVQTERKLDTLIVSILNKTFLEYKIDVEENLSTRSFR
jgi:type I restriction enzyme, S subunit